MKDNALLKVKRQQREERKKAREDKKIKVERRQKQVDKENAENLPNAKKAKTLDQKDKCTIEDLSPEMNIPISSTDTDSNENSLSYFLIVFKSDSCIVLLEKLV